MALFRIRTDITTTADEFSEVIRRRSGGTNKSWETDVGRLRAAVALLGVRYCEEITPFSVARVLSAKETEGRSARTVNSYREILHRFCSFLLLEKGVEFRRTGATNPVSSVPRRRVPAPVIVFLEREEYEALLDGLSSHPDLRAMVSVMLFSGVRRGELLWLTKADVDLEQGLLHVRAKAVDGESWQPKTGSNRAVPIPSRLKEEFGNWRSPPGTPWYFASRRGTRLDGDNFSRSLRSVQKPLSTTWSCLDFRHTYGTALARSGMSLFQISRLMGNSPQIVAKHYAFLRAQDVRAEGVFPERGTEGREAEAGARRPVQGDAPGAASPEQSPVEAEDEKPAVEGAVASLSGGRKVRSRTRKVRRLPTRKQTFEMLRKRLRRARVKAGGKAAVDRSRPSPSGAPDGLASSVPPVDPATAALARIIQECAKRNRQRPPEATGS